MEVLQSLNYIWAVVTFLGGVVIAVRFIMKGKGADDNDTIQKYEAALRIRNTEIDDLKDQVEKLTKQIESLNKSVVELQTEKRVLAETVTGKDYLVELTKSVEGFHAFAVQATNEHREMIAALKDIKTMLDLTHRNGD